MAALKWLGAASGIAGATVTHHVHILEMNGDSYRLNQSKKRRKSPKIPEWHQPSGPWLTRWVHRDRPRALLRQRLMHALRRPRGSLLWTTGTTAYAATCITPSGAFLNRPVMYFYSGVDSRYFDFGVKIFPANETDDVLDHLQKRNESR